MPRYKVHNLKLADIIKEANKGKEPEHPVLPGNAVKTAPTTTLDVTKGSGVLARLDDITKKNKVKVKLKP